MRAANAFATLLLAGLASAYEDQKPVALIPDFLADGIRSHVSTTWRIVSPSTASADDFQKAVALVSSPARGMTELEAMLQRMPAGQLLQVPMTGTDRLNLSAVPERFTVCNVHGAAVAISEYVLAAVLSWNVQIPAMDAEFRRCSWHSTNDVWHQTSNDCQRRPPHVQSKGQTVGIIGYGAIGSATAERAAALGMRVIAVTWRAPVVAPPPLAWIGNDTMLPRLMQEADFVVVTCPLLPSTTGMVNGKAIGSMKPSGVLINVARGPIVDEAALYQALEKGSIGGAVLDVWWHEDWSAHGTGPSSWPATHNFSALPNVWMTPHQSYNTEGTIEESIKQIAANFDALARGEPLQNVVRPGAPGSAGMAYVI